jgi:MoxR-like ATPase
MDCERYEAVLTFLANNCQSMGYTNVLVYGHSGIGKTAIPKQVAKNLEIPYILLDATGMEPSDLIGLPFKEQMNGDNSELCTRFLPPKFIKAMEKSERGIFIMDEVTRLDLQVRNTWMQFLSEGILGEVKRPEGWLVVQTANPADEGYQVQELDIALVRRSIVLQLDYDLEVWRDWAAGKYRSKNGNPISARVIAAAGRLNKGLVKPVKNRIQPTLTPDGLRVCSELIEAGLMEQLDKDTAISVMSGAVGSEAALSIYSQLSDKRLQELLKLALDNKPIKFGSNDHDIAVDLMYLFLEHVNKKPKAYAEHVLNMYNCLPDDIKIALIKAVYSYFAKYPKEYDELRKVWQTWCTEHALMMGTRK